MKVSFAVLLALVASAAPVEAQTAHYTGERVTGTTKQCFYAYAGSTYTRTIQSYQVCPMSIQVPRPNPAPEERTVTAFYTGERVTGTTKQCFYEFAGSTYTLTLQSYEVCRPTARFRVR